MQVSISKAAHMVGVTRATLYRHIDKKGITVKKDEDDNPKIDVSELIRVYGDKIKPEGQESKKSSDNGTSETIQSKQDKTPSNSLDMTIDTEVLRERIKNLELNETLHQKERNREREQLTEQIDMLRDSLRKSEEQQKRITLLLTDQREGKEEKINAWETSFKSLEARIANQESTANKREEERQKILRQNHALKKALEQEKSKGLWQKLFGTNQTRKRG